jgi:metallo-beta-lactamase family protein
MRIEAQTVTGAKYLIHTKINNILINCVLFQEYKELRLRNWTHLLINPKTIDYILLTHADIDHSDYILLLIKNGFRGKFLCTAATKDLCSILLPDSGYLHEEDTRYANRNGYSKHQRAFSLYTPKEAEGSFRYFQAISFEDCIQINKNLYATFERLNWLAHLKAPPKLFITHGELEVARALKSQIEQRFHWKCGIPSYLDSAILCGEPK